MSRGVELTPGGYQQAMKTILILLVLAAIVWFALTYMRGRGRNRV